MGVIRFPFPCSTFLQNCKQALRCTYTSETGFPFFPSSARKLNPSLNLASSEGLNTPFPLNSPLNSNFNGISPPVSSQQPKTNAGNKQIAAASTAFCWMHPSPVRLAKMGPSKGRGPLIAKFAPVGFKKGFGAVGLGKHTKKGFFLINSMLVPKFHFADLNEFGLKPYVCPQTYKLASQKFWDGEK